MNSPFVTGLLSGIVASIIFAEVNNFYCEYNDQRITLFSQKLSGRYKCDIYSQTNSSNFKIDVITKINDHETFVYGVPNCFDENSCIIVMLIDLDNKGYMYIKQFKYNETIILTEVLNTTPLKLINLTININVKQ